MLIRFGPRETFAGVKTKIGCIDPEPKEKRPTPASLLRERTATSVSDMGSASLASVPGALMCESLLS